jgi:RNA polymerase sigma-70 factor (ECF subfamily)
MDHLPPTAPSLLVRLRDARDGMAWDQFVEIYSPLIYHFARSRGLQDADAADLMQDVLGAVAQGIQTFDYDPARGLFRSWLLTIVRHRLASRASRRQRHPEERATSLEGDDDQSIERLASDDEAEWQRGYQLRLLHWGLDRIRHEFEDRTWRAFWLTALERQPAREVGEQLGLTQGAVYIAKSRIVARLKDRLRQIDDDSGPSWEE